MTVGKAAASNVITDTYPKVRTNENECNTRRKSLFNNTNPPPVSGMADTNSAYVRPITITNNPPIKSDNTSDKSSCNKTISERLPSPSKHAQY